MTTIYNKQRLCDICPEFNQLEATNSCDFCYLDICDNHTKQVLTHNPFLIKQYEISYKKKHVFFFCPNCFDMFKKQINDILMKEMDIRQKYINKFADDFQKLKNETNELWKNLLEKFDNSVDI